MIQIIGSTLYQWDINRSIKVSDSNATHIHLANQGDSKAVIMELVNSQARIPNYLLQTGKTLLAYAVVNGVTIKRKSFVVQNRERPENYVYDEDNRNYIYELITASEEAVENANAVAEELRTAKENGEFKGSTGDPGPKGDSGVSPVLSVEEIDGGHRVIIEDVNGLSTFDVMDGSGGGSVAPLIVTLDDEWMSSGSGEASHTSVDIANHMAKGGNVILNALGYQIPVAYANDGQAVFTNMDGTVKAQIDIDSGGYYRTFISSFITTDDLGELNTALDGIIALQQSYIRGDIE